MSSTPVISTRSEAIHQPRSIWNTSIIPILILFCLLCVPAPSLLAQGKTTIRGTYAHPKALWDTGARLNEYGVNFVFIHSGGFDEATFKRAKPEGCKVFAKFATLNGSYGHYRKGFPRITRKDAEGEFGFVRLSACFRVISGPVQTTWPSSSECLQ
jgi:hypothetical protein